MAIDNANFISELTPSVPLNIDPRAEGAAQIRAVKTAVQSSFPNVDAEVSADAATMNATFTNPLIVPGMVMMWNGLDAAVPDGWALCNGATYDSTYHGLFNYATPDLRGLFVKAASTGTDLGKPVAGPNADDNGSHTIDLTTQVNVTVEEHALTIEELPEHSHGVWVQDNTYSGGDNEAPEYPGTPITGDNQNSPNGIYKGSTNRDADDLIEVTGGAQGHDHNITFDGEFNNQPEHYVLSYIVFVGHDATVNTPAT